MPSQDPVQLEQAVTRWLERAIRRYRFYMDKYGVGFSQSLWNSFTTNIIRSSGGNISKLEINFLYYGRFVDMGVGRGFPIGSRSKLGDDKFLSKRNERGQLRKAPGRKPKKWYAKTTTFEIGRLGDILQKEFGLETPKFIENAMKNISLEIEM